MGVTGPSPLIGSINSMILTTVLVQVGGTAAIRHGEGGIPVCHELLHWAALDGLCGMEERIGHK